MTIARPYPLMCYLKGSRKLSAFGWYSKPGMRMRAYTRLIELRVHTRERTTFVKPVELPDYKYVD